MVHPETLTRHSPYFDYKTLSTTCRQLEQEYGLAVDNGFEQVRENRLSHKVTTIEAQTGQESFEFYAKRHKEKIRDALERAQDWQALHEGLKASGLEVQPHGNGLVIKDLRGNHAAKASAVDRSLSAKRLQERFAKYQPYRSLRQIQELSRYQAAPLHRSVEQGERGELFAKYKAGIETRKTTLEAIKAQEDKQLAAIHQQWTPNVRKSNTWA